MTRTGYNVREGSLELARRAEAQLERDVAAGEDEGEYVGEHTEDISYKLRGDFSCLQCGASMNPAEKMLGPVCGRCCRENHRAATR